MKTSATTKNVKKQLSYIETGSRDRLGVGWSHTHMWQIKIRRDISAIEVPPEAQRVLAQHQSPPAQASSARKRSPRNFWL